MHLRHFYKVRAKFTWNRVSKLLLIFLIKKLICNESGPWLSIWIATRGRPSNILTITLHRLLYYSPGLHFPSSIALITHTAVTNHTLISHGLPLSDCQVFYSIYHSPSNSYSMEPVLVFSLVIVLSCTAFQCFSEYPFVSPFGTLCDPAWTSAVYPGLSLFVLAPLDYGSWAVRPHLFTGLHLCLAHDITCFPLFDPLAFLWPRLGIKLAYGSVCLSSLSLITKSCW